MISVSWVILTYNRAEIVARSVEHNLKNAGRTIDEIIWVDNGSTDVPKSMCSIANVCVANPTNLGVAKGSNQGYRLARSEYIVNTQCDTLMPEGWLATFEEYITKIPGIPCMFTVDISHVPERKKAEPTTINGLLIQPALPMPFHMIRRDLWEGSIGYYREDFGLYGWEDVEWAERALLRMNWLGYQCYSIPGQLAVHIGSEGNAEWNGMDPQEYYEFKKREADDPKKLLLLSQLRAQGNPYYNPWSMK